MTDELIKLTSGLFSKPTYVEASIPDLTLFLIESSKKLMKKVENILEFCRSEIIEFL